MSLETISKEKDEKNLETSLEIFKIMVDKRMKREALEYFDALEENAKTYIKSHPEGNMYLREASLYGI